MKLLFYHSLFLFLFLLGTLIAAVVTLSIYSGYELHMQHGFPLKAATLLTPLGMLANALPLEGQSFMKYLDYPAVRDGLNIWNSIPLLIVIVAIQLLAWNILQRSKACSNQNIGS